MINTRIITKQVAVEEKEPVSIICDDCGTEYSIEDVFEIQEFHHIRRVGGYGSVFGDSDKIECDICQHCLKKMIDGKYRITESY